MVDTESILAVYPQCQNLMQKLTMLHMTTMEQQRPRFVIHGVAEKTGYKLYGCLNCNHLKCALEGRTKYTTMLSVVVL